MELLFLLKASNSIISKVEFTYVPGQFDTHASGNFKKVLGATVERLLSQVLVFMFTT